MVTKTIPAVYERGVFRVKEPVDLEEGQEVDLQIRVRQTPQLSPNERIKALLAEWDAEPDEESEEWWEEFRAFLKENRLNFPERDLGLFDE